MLQRRKPLGRGSKPLARTGQLTSVTPLRRGGPIRPVSDRRQAENAQRRAMIAGLAGGERPLCDVWAAMAPEWCTRWADDAHEPLSRARLGSITDPGNCRFLCRACHDLVTFRPESEIGWAFRLGLVRHDQLCCQGRAVCSRYATGGAA